jgi:hypothetical protein
LGNTLTLSAFSFSVVHWLKYLEDSACVSAIDVAGQRDVLVGIFKGTAQGLEKIFVYHLTRK